MSKQLCDELNRLLVLNNWADHHFKEQKCEDESASKVTQQIEETEGLASVNELFI